MYLIAPKARFRRVPKQNPRAPGNALSAIPTDREELQSGGRARRNDPRTTASTSQPCPATTARNQAFKTDVP